jgi:hypothetical protein
MNQSPVKFFQLIVPQSVASATVLPTGAAITAQTYGTTVDTAGYSYLQVVVAIGANSANAFSSLSMQESDTTASFAAYPAQGSGGASAGIFGTSSTLSLTSYSDTASAQQGQYYAPVVSTLPSGANVLELINIDLKGRKRYQHLAGTTGSGGATTLISAIAILSRAELSPKTATQYGVDQLLQSPCFAY